MSDRTEPRYTTERQDRNGVHVRVTRWRGGGTTVDAACGCFGLPFRVHTSADCPAYLRRVTANLID